MAKSPPRSSQIPMLLPIGKASTQTHQNAKAKPERSAAGQVVPRSQDRRDALIERLRRDGFFELRKDK